MAVIEELIRLEDNGTLSFGNYMMESKRKVLDFEDGGNLYQVKTYKEITRLEKNGKLLLETVPGATIHQLYMDDKKVAFSVEALDDVQITMELENEMPYTLLIDQTNVGNVKANVAGKISFSVELAAEIPAKVEIQKIM